MKIFVTGSTGLIGSQLCQDLVKQNHHVIECHHGPKNFKNNSVSMDLLQISSLNKIFSKIKPDVVVHCGAITDVDYCENHPETAYTVNSDSTEEIANICNENKIFLIYLSTDYVFNGSKGDYKESDPVDPINVYGMSKLEGENRIKSFGKNWCIIRTSTPFGIHSTKQSFPIFVINSIKNSKKIKIPIDQITSPTFVKDLSLSICEIINKKITGLYNISGSTQISRLEFANLIAKNCTLNEHYIIPSYMHDLDWIARRPKNSSLNVNKINSILDKKCNPIHNNLKSFITELNSQKS